MRELTGHHCSEGEKGVKRKWMCFGIFYQHFELCKHLNGHEFEQTSGDSEGQGSLACCSSCGHKEMDMTVNEQQKA